MDNYFEDKGFQLIIKSHGKLFRKIYPHSLIHTYRIIFKIIFFYDEYSSCKHLLLNTIIIINDNIFKVIEKWTSFNFNHSINFIYISYDYVHNSHHLLKILVSELNEIQIQKFDQFIYF